MHLEWNIFMKLVLFIRLSWKEKFILSSKTFINNLNTMLRFNINNILFIFYTFWNSILRCTICLNSLCCFLKDLAARNIMVDENGICKIFDFKMSYRLKTDDDYEIQVFYVKDSLYCDHFLIWWTYSIMSFNITVTSIFNILNKIYFLSYQTLQFWQLMSTFVNFFNLEVLIKYFTYFSQNKNNYKT